MKILNLIILLGVITVNALANILPINGVTTGEVSAQFDNYFTPAGFTFSIWSLIYLGLLVFAVYQFFSKSYNPEVIGSIFVVNGIANVSWILAWHYGYFTLTVLLMGVLLGTLVLINLRIKESSGVVKLPFRIYLGWICVATVANLAVYLKYLDTSIFDDAEVTWAILFVIIAGGLGVAMLVKKGWVPTTLTIAWGIGGIYSKQVEFGQANTYQMVCLIVLIALILSSLFWMGFAKRIKLLKIIGK